MTWQHILVWSLFMAAGACWALVGVFWWRDHKTKKTEGAHRG